MHDINSFMAQVPAKAAARSTFAVDPEATKAIDEFVEYLVKDCGFSKGSAASYRTYVTKPMALGTDWEHMTSSERSGARKFAEWLESRKD